MSCTVYNLMRGTDRNRENNMHPPEEGGGGGGGIQKRLRNQRYTSKVL